MSPTYTKNINRCVPKSEEAIFSTGKRTAGKLMALTISFLLAIPGFRDRCEVHNVENLIIDMGPTDKRKISCYPGSVAVRFLFVIHFCVFPLAMDGEREPFSEMTRYAILIYCNYNGLLVSTLIVEGVWYLSFSSY